MLRTHPLKSTHTIDGRLENYLLTVGSVFVTAHRPDSGNTIFGVAIGDERWFVKYGQHKEAIDRLESVIALHESVRHRAIIPIVGAIRTPSGLGVVMPWLDAEPLNDPLMGPMLSRLDGHAPFTRFRQLPVPQIVRALTTIFDAHVAVVSKGFVAVDFYDGSILYDFDHSQVLLCDLDLYRPGPFALDCDRQYGSRRFMAPEEFTRGSQIDERTTVYTLGRTAFVFLSSGLRGEEGFGSWRANQALFHVAQTAVRPQRSLRFATVAALQSAWRSAVSGACSDE
jgi:serine/threonine-protein kinase